MSEPSFELATYRSVHGLPDNPLVRCDCGRSTNADMLVDIRALPVAVRGAQEFACDGCRNRLFRTGTITRSAFYEALGAPQTLVDKVSEADA